MAEQIHATSRPEDPLWIRWLRYAAEDIANPNRRMMSSPQLLRRIVDEETTALYAEIRQLRGEVERVRVQAEHDLDVLRTRLVDEHEGSPGMEHARLWEKQCHEAEMARDAALLEVERLRKSERMLTRACERNDNERTLGERLKGSD